ncbi:hypothetical protein [Yersinia ruckeri]|uniref:hypothetical protein n=1 Tax=Yersinia ruckeri TaxID=29486 RepID=UPI0022372DEA|nr:hypothetical protein [Yersinia ruckeri]MCW6598681.1 hypothetical protein [Yersinia ruckeri]
MNQQIPSAIKAAIAVTPTDNREMQYLRNLLITLAKDVQGAPNSFVISNPRDDAKWNNRPDRETGMWLFRGTEVNVFGPSGQVSSQIDLLFDDGVRGYLLTGYRVTVYDANGKSKFVTRTEGSNAYTNNKVLASKVKSDLVKLLGFDPADPAVRNSADILSSVKETLTRLSQDATNVMASCVILQSLQIQLPQNISFTRGIISANERSLLDFGDNSLARRIAQDFLVGSNAKSTLTINATFRDAIVSHRGMESVADAALFAFMDKNKCPLKVSVDSVGATGTTLTLDLILSR